ncbi:hypothetical protein GCM10020001_068620 [Nonomuraea salmonea]
MLMQIVPISGWMKNHIQVPVQNATIARTVIANAARNIVAGTLIRLISRQITPQVDPGDGQGERPPEVEDHHGQVEHGEGRHDGLEQPGSRLPGERGEAWKGDRWMVQGCSADRPTISDYPGFGGPGFPDGSLAVTRASSAAVPGKHAGGLRYLRSGGATASFDAFDLSPAKTAAP